MFVARALWHYQKVWSRGATLIFKAHYGNEDGDSGQEKQKTPESFLVFFTAAPVAYEVPRLEVESEQAAGRHHSHSNLGSWATSVTYAAISATLDP